MINTDVEITEEVELDYDNSDSTLKKYYVFGFSGNEEHGAGLIVTKYKTCPYPLKGLRLIWQIGAINTTKPFGAKNNYEPNVGDVGQTRQGESIEVKSVNYI
jgi:hypothetical protein